MRFRKLRIAWSVGCAIACVLLIVLWVRSYWSADTVSVNTLSRGWAADITSWDGRLRFSAFDKMPMEKKMSIMHNGSTMPKGTKKMDK